MLTQLHDYYQSQGICAINFNCPFYGECSKSCQDTFTSAKEAFVSSGYVSHELPRILFLSLDSGSADQDPKHKTLEYIRQQEEFDQDVLALPKNKHWYRTHELAYRILRHFKNDMNIGDAKTYFAHINSAKCCMNNPGRAQANSLLFDNCREFIPGEIGILAPDILVTQGAFAHQVVKTYPQIFKDMNIEGKNLNGMPEEIKVLEIFSKPTVWIQTFHPRNPSSKKNRDNYLNYEEFIIRFLERRSEFKFQKGILKNESNVMIENMKRKVNFDIKGVKTMENCTGDYIWLIEDPKTPEQKYPSKEECLKYEFIKLSQLCEITQQKGLGRSSACNDFGGDKGQYKVVSERKVRAVCHKTQPRKFILTESAIAYLKEIGILEW